MKEHPDYKYRPRRKPKTMVPKKSDIGITNGGNPVTYSVRDLLPQQETSATTTAGTTQQQSSTTTVAAAAAAAAVAIAKFPRSYFSPYPRHNIHHYPSPFYQQVANDLSVPKDLSTTTGADVVNETSEKSVHELAMQAIYGTSLYSHAVSLANAWRPIMTVTTAATVTPAVCGVGCGDGGGPCPVSCTVCHHHIQERPQLLSLPSAAHHLPMSRSAHESSASSSTPSPPAQLPAPLSLATATTIKRPIALLSRPERVTPAGYHPQHVI